ncbi:DUF3253 domain-containing protein [Caballeronia sp. LP006]|jgi:hypothetical protein|uniref:DUF3253 domain-containing protein n=1 Tax=unclassified Caballeronia TaxID=2646786 RepID=UPI002027816D|nr:MULTISPECIES: DUF3253 domain-containing protein [unclassified Caballeronia]MDR5800187.1 DUF3253 domain-containing protein [Caballeronia sp. LZ001]MDR5827701.1 DUF3253 domain-containing protein [Caballeronia sp. LP006]
MSVSTRDIENCALDLLGGRAATSSICPSDVARNLVSDEDGWRALMPLVRDVAAQMAREGKVLITQGDVTLDPDAMSHGPIRLRRGPAFPASA